ncbi:MAG: hypothetical protein O2890_10770 [Cyanobacteria bacterium]|nr:hypothetical protein [Cyanobacteriota bacterium]MDA0866881.1 hypothetical protein [Cyanobacteriota bacterium]
MAIALLGCSQADWATLTPAPTAAEQTGMVAYGGAGQLSPQEWAKLQSLAWPQNYRDMKGTFGFPAWRNESADVYRLADGSEVWVFYEGRQATGYELR